MNSIETNPGVSEKPAPTIDAAEKIDALKKNTAPLEKARAEFENKSCRLDIMNRFEKLYSPPAMNYQKIPYETLFLFRRAEIQNEVFDFLHAAITRGEKNINSALAGFIEQKIAKFKKLDKNKNGKIEYVELGPDAEVREGLECIGELVAFPAELKKDKNFDLKNRTIDKNVDGKKKFIKNYLAKFSAKMIDRSTGEPIAGSRLQLARMSHSMVLWVVGGEQLTIDQFNSAWKEAEDDPNLAKIYSGENPNSENTSVERARGDFEKLCELDDKKIIELRKKVDSEMIKQKQRMDANPHGHLLRKLGGLENVFVYFGKDALIATILLNLALAKFSPTAFLSNPVALTAVAAVGGLAYHYDPELLAGKSPIEKGREDELRAEFKNAPPPIQNWLAKFKKSDLGPKGEIGKLLADEDRSEISSAELAPLLGKNESAPDGEILPSSDAARKIFLLFHACQKRDINPSSFFENA